MYWLRSKALDEFKHITSTGEPIVTTSSASEITTTSDESVKITDSEELVQIANEPVEAADSIITTQAVKETVTNNSSNGFMQSTIDFLSYILSIILKISF